ncbi:MAG TPA: MraY family glycosyltransferase [Chloroflexia bacterium]|nr:MraY family glycosyltransferase [Chloroflexia bacterium]
MIDPLFAMPLIFVVTLGLSFGLTVLVRKVALQRGLVDEPGEERRVHRVPIPRLGGLAMFAAFAVGVLLTFVFDIRAGKSGNAAFEGSRVLLMLLGAGIITLVMAVDDIRGLRPVTRLIWQIGSALLVIIPSLIWPGGPNVITPLDGSPPFIETPGTRHYDQGAGVLALTVQNPFGGSIEMPLVIAVLFTIVWLVGMTNTINWIDGLDGLAAGVSVVACGVLFWITGFVVEQWTLAYLPLILGAAILGFLPFNIHPARIFMGDSGAMFLGFTLAVIAIIGGAKLAAALLVLGVPILDAIYLVIYRLYRGQSPMSPDRAHLHHRLLDLGFSQQQVVLIFYALSATFGVLGLLLPSGLLKLIALLAMATILVGLLIYIARRKFDRVSAQK